MGNNIQEEVHPDEKQKATGWLGIYFEVHEESSTVQAKQEASWGDRHPEASILECREGRRTKKSEGRRTLTLERVSRWHQRSLKHRLLGPVFKFVIQPVWGGPGNPHFWKFPGDAGATGPGTTVANHRVRSPVLGLVWVWFRLCPSCAVCLISSCKVRGGNNPHGTAVRNNMGKTRTQCSGHSRHSKCVPSIACNEKMDKK